MRWYVHFDCWVQACVIRVFLFSRSCATVSTLPACRPLQPRPPSITCMLPLSGLCGHLVTLSHESESEGERGDVQASAFTPDALFVLRSVSVVFLKLHAGCTCVMPVNLGYTRYACELRLNALGL
jgi:hypothetical protein